MTEIGTCEVNYMGEWISAKIMESEYAKEPLYLMDGETVGDFVDVFDCAPRKVKLHEK